MNIPKNTRFLVTGGAGFIGSNIAESLLDKGFYVRVVDNFITGKKENIEKFYQYANFEFIEGDIRDYSVCLDVTKNIDYVLHQAALGSIPRSIDNPMLSNDINVSGFVNILYACYKNNVKKIVYASSSSVYGDSIVLPKKEGTEGNVLAPYALTKKIDEMYAEIFYKIYNVKSIGLRYFNVYGPRQDEKSVYAPVIPIFINKIINNEPIVIYGDKDIARDFTYVEDVVDINVKACLNDIECDVFNVAYGQKTTLYDLYEKICNCTDHFVNVIYKEKRKGDIKESLADISKAVNLLGYSPQFQIDNGIKKTIEWYKKNKAE